jgi:hypothetical protein
VRERAWSALLESCAPARTSSAAAWIIVGASHRLGAEFGGGGAGGLFVAGELFPAGGEKAL